MGTACAEQATEAAFTCHHVHTSLLCVRKEGAMGSPSSSQPQPSVSELLSHSSLSMMWYLHWSRLLHPETGQHPAFQPPHTEPLA